MGKNEKTGLMSGYERDTGVEPVSPPWKGGIEPLN